MTFVHVIPPWVNIALVVIGLAFCVLGFRSVTSRTRSTRWSWIRRSAVVGLIGLMGLGPATIGYWELSTTNITVYFVVDATGSMAAEDYNGNEPRTQGVKNDLVAIADSIPEARFSIIEFSSISTQQLPMTTDLRAVHSWADIYDREPTDRSHGSDVNRPIDELLAIFEKSEELRPNEIRILYYFGDGESTDTEYSSSQAIPEFGNLAKFVDHAYVLGYGTAEGGQMKFLPSYGEPSADRYITDPATGQNAVSYLNEETLKLVADQLNGTYEHRTGPSSVAGVIPDISDYEIEELEGETPVYTPVIWPIAIALWALIMWEIWVLIPRIKSTRKLEAEDPAVGWFG